ncbi:MAG: methionine adenosyltransferase [Candidatus Izemoplasmatales bacterium]|nr:methionine adenosyltransferase [Candidatus Izemoplasmatales bacterium]
MRKVISSESVFDGHPDKICDRISDEILDEILKEDINARVAIETAIKNNTVYIFGEVTTKANIDYSAVVNETLLDLGYTKRFNIIENISKQSPDIALGVDRRDSKLQGAGDQGMMYGYATSETKERIPAPLALAHKIARRYKYLRENAYIGIFAPDGKCQVSYLYENDKPIQIQTIVVSAQTKCSIDPELLDKIIRDELLKPLIGSLEGINILVNPTGEFLIGGPDADAGLTGRKIIVGTYGGFSHHGGGAFSGKDTSKVDRSAAYYARYAAKAFVDAGLADRCEVGVAYAIGVAEPVSLYIDTFGTGKLSDEELLYLLKLYFDFSPSNIRKEIRLDKVKFTNLSAFGHMGRIDLDVQWEDTESKADELRDAYVKAKRTAQVL